MTISQVSGKTGLSRAAVRRCLHTLNQLGFVRAEDGKYFSLSPRVLALSHAYTSSSRLPVAAQPVLEQLSGVLHESCSWPRSTATSCSTSHELMCPGS